MQPIGELREMNADDREPVGALLNGIFRTQNNVLDQDVFSDFPLVFTPANYRNCRVITVENRIVSHAAVFPSKLIIDDRQYKTGVIILVATDAKHRQRGHAACLMRELQRIMAEENYDLGVLWTGVPRFYEKLGWEIVTTRGLMIDDLLSEGLEELETADRAEVEIMPYDQGQHLMDIIRLHDCEPVRTIRSRDEFRVLMELPKLNTWILCRGGRVAAYIVIGQAHNKNGVLEYGGDEEDITSLTARVIRENDFEQPLQMLFFAPYMKLAERFRAAGARLHPLECSKGLGYEMIYVVGEKTFPDEWRQKLFIWGPDST